MNEAQDICSTWRIALQTMIPKREIGALDFLEMYPDCDGRGTIIAIWDTGIDPTANGLQVTSDGKPKVLDFVDASGSGDVRIFKKFNITPEKRTIRTLTGRLVTIPNSWSPVDGIIRVGAKPAYEIFPSMLMEQIKNDAKNRYWSPQIHRVSDKMKEFITTRQTESSTEQATPISELRVPDGTDVSQTDPKSRESSASLCGELYSAESDPPTTPPLSSVCAAPIDLHSVAHNFHSVEEIADALEVKLSIATSKSPAISSTEHYPNINAWLDSLSNDECERSIKQMEKLLKTLNTNSECYGPIFDCFLFKGQDGDFVACIDITPYEDTTMSLEDLPLMKDFSIDRQVGSLGKEILLYFTVKILDEGRLLQIVTNSGSHGTHVASIAASYYPPTSSHTASNIANRNGIAPGAQLVSVKIADTHLASMETIVALLSAINWTSKLNCDIVNYSFGEFAYLPNFGRIYHHFSQFILQENVAFVVSGGNNGPSLGTVGCPGGALDLVIGVAPLVFPDMMEYLYSKPIAQRREIATPLKSVSTLQNTSQLSRYLPPSTYTWGSRGPAPDGGLGLTVAAPGAAIADVAAWQCNSSVLLNGSSMSSPSVAGAIALVLSAIRQRSAKNRIYSGSDPIRIPHHLWRAAIFQTASPIKHLSPLDQGAGMFQVGTTFTFLDRLLSLSCSSIDPKSDSPIENSDGIIDKYSGWHIRCSINGPGCILESKKQHGNRGLWLRNGWLPPVAHSTSNLLPVLSYNLHIQPEFTTVATSEFKRQFNLNLTILFGYGEIDQSALNLVYRPDWLSLAPHLLLTNKDRCLPMLIDPNLFSKANHSIESLQEEMQENCSSSHTVDNPPSQPYHTCISFVIVDSHLPHVIARIPITIQLPLSPFYDHDNGVHRFNFRGDFMPENKVCRWFIRIPNGSSAGIIRVRRSDISGSSCTFTITTMIPLPLGSGKGSGSETCWNMMCLQSGGSRNCELNRKNDPSCTYDSSSGEYLFAFALPWAGTTLEVTIAQNWGSEASNCSLTGSVIFHGLQLQPEKLILHSSQQFVNLSLRSNFGVEGIQFCIKPKHWVLPLKPVSHDRSYHSFSCPKVGLGLSGAHSLRLTYKFNAPFKSQSATFSFGRLTALLYDADFIMVSYKVYNSSAEYLGAGSYQAEGKPKYQLTLTKGSYSVVALILYAECERFSYDAGESDFLDRFKSAYPLLVKFILPESISNLGSGAQLSLECSTSIATMGLEGVDFSKSSFNSSISLGDSHEEFTALEKVDQDSNGFTTPSPSGKHLLSQMRSFVGVPHSICAGENISLVIGINEEQLAHYAVPGSYFEGVFGVYSNQNLRYAIKYPFEIIVGPNQNVNEPLQDLTIHSAYGILPRDLERSKYIAEDLFGHHWFDWKSSLIYDSQAKCTGSNAISLQAACSPQKMEQLSKKTSHNSESPSSNWNSLLLKLVSAFDTHCTDRDLVWDNVNQAMGSVIEFAKFPMEAGRPVLPQTPEILSKKPPFDPAIFLLQHEYFSENSPNIILLQSRTVNSSPDGQDAASVADENEKSDGYEKKVDNLDVFNGFHRPPVSSATILECLSIYGTCVCERIINARAALSTGRWKCNLVALELTLDILLSRVNKLLSPAEVQTSVDSVDFSLFKKAVWHPLCLRNLFAGRNLPSPYTSSDSSRLRGPLFSFWLAHLFVLHNGLPLLCVLVNLSFQLEEPAVSKSTTSQPLLGAKKMNVSVNSPGFVCSSIAFPWMIQALHRIGLGCLAKYYERQLPMKFPEINYNIYSPAK